MAVLNATSTVSEQRDSVDVAAWIESDMELADMREAALGCRVPRLVLAQLAQLAADGRVAMPRRVTALTVAAELLVYLDCAPPESALDAADDAAVIAAAVATQSEQALTGILAVAPSDAITNATRRLIGHKLVAAGRFGPHVTRLLIDGGDWNAAIEAAVIDHCQPADVAEELILARAWVCVSWHEQHRESMFLPFVAELRRKSPSAIDALLEDIAMLPGLAESQCEQVVADVQAVIEEQS